jgi:release factor glutamine methyltransferase
MLVFLSGFHFTLSPMETDTISKAPKILGTAKLLGRELITKYDSRESEALVRILVEHVTKKPYKWLLMNPDAVFSDEDFFVWEAFSARLRAGEPIQYITGEAWFYGLELHVNPAVLIPRPETEELVQWIIDIAQQQSTMNIIDVGTGSGAIALALAHAIPSARVIGLDVSPAALETATANAARLGLPVLFHNCDVLATLPDTFQDVDLLVSNPPYIPQGEYQQLEDHVRLHEPELALAVADAEPLIIYNKVCLLGKTWLRPGGRLFFEIHADFGPQVVALLAGEGYRDVTLKQDMGGRDRMVMGLWPG